MKTNTRNEARTFGCLTFGFLALLGLVWGWFVFTALPVITIPNPPLPNPNAFDLAVKATAAQGTNTADLDKFFGPRTNKRLTFEESLQRYHAHQSQVEAWLKSNAPALQLLRRSFDYQYREPAQRGLVGLSPHYSGFRELARTLSVESNAHAAKGDWKGATRSALDTIYFGHQIPRGTPLIGALVGYAVQAIGRRKLEELLPHLDAATCRAAARELEKQYFARVPLSEVFQEEKWTTTSNLLNMMQSNKAQALGLQIAGYNVATKKPNFHLVSRRRLIKDFLAYMDALSASAKQPYAKATAPTAPANFFTGQMAPVFERSRWNAAKAESGHTLLMLGFALRAYKLEHGDYPKQLSQMVPTYLKAIPTDGFGGGETLHYQKTGDKYLLWSIGPDGKDDSGKPVDNPGKTETTGRYLVKDDSKGDFVFGINR